MWVKSRRSAQANNCVEVSTNLLGTQGRVFVRDSKDPHGPALAFTAAEWDAFLAGAAGGEFGIQF